MTLAELAEWLDGKISEWPWECGKLRLDRKIAGIYEAGGRLIVEGRTDFSDWPKNDEIGVNKACNSLGFIALSPQMLAEMLVQSVEEYRALWELLHMDRWFQSESAVLNDLNIPHDRYERIKKKIEDLK